MPRKKPHTESEDVLQIRCMWETVSVFQFVGLFRSKFQFTQFDLQDFEYSLAQEESILVADIFARLLRFSLQRTDIQIFNWEGYIQRFIRDRAPRSKDFLTKFPYRGLNPSDRLLLLKQVVDTVYSCHAEDLTDYLDDYYSPNDMRFLSIGQDAVNNQYWYFNDLRLYKDQVTPKKGKSAWQCICSCLEEWQAFLKTISKSQHPDEISLYHYLHDEVIPLIQGALEDKKLKAKQRRKRLKQAAKEGKEADVLREYSLPKIDYQELFRREREDIEKMSDELTKLAQLANSADLQVTTQTLHSPSLPTIKEEGMMRKRLEDNGLQGDSDLAAKMCIKGDKTTGRNKMIKESDEDDSVFLPDHAGNGPEATKDEKVPPRSKRKSEAKVKEMDWCSNDADNIKMSKVNGDKNQVSDGAGMPPHVMQYHTASQFPMAGSQQVFVFSTRMANQAAQAIYTGQADSILSYHRSQAAHRDYLHPEQDTLPDVMHPQGNMPTQNPQLTTLNQPMMMDPNNSNPMQGMLMNQQVQHPSIPHHQAQAQVMDTVNNEHANGKSGGRKRPDRPNSINTDSNNPSKNQTASHKNVTSDGNTGKQSDSNVTTTTVTTKSSKSKSSKRKRPPSSSQQLQPNMTQGPHLSNMPPASNFGAFPQQPFGPGQFPAHPQQMPGIPNMGMRPPLQGTPPQSGPLFQMEATETENLDPSALWENPPCNKKTPNLANLAWQQEQQMRMMQQQQGSGSQLPMMQHQQSSMMSPCHETMITNRPYSEGSQSQEHPEMAPFSPASGPGMPFEMTNYKPPQQIDNPTPEQLRHREERLRTLKEMQRLLFPEEHQTRSPTPGRLVSPSGGMGSPPGNMMTSGPGMMRPPGSAGMMGPQQRPIMHLPTMGPHPNMDNPDPAMGLSPEHRMAQEQIIMPPPPDWDNMTPPQKEWYKLQHDFYALKRRKTATEQMKIGHGPIPELHGAGYRDSIDMGPYHHGMPSGPGIGIGMGPGPGIGPGIPHGLPGDPGMPPTINRCMPGADMDVSNQGAVGPGMTGSGMPGMPGQGMPMPDMPGQTGQGMPPPPPYHGTHNAATPTMPRRSSLSGPGTLAMNQSTPFPMSPHHIPSGQPSPRSNRTNSLPASGSVPPTTTGQLPTGQVPTGNELKSSLITSGKVTTVITSGSMPTGPVQTSGSSVTTGSVTIGSQQTPSTQAGPVSRQPMSPQQGSPFRTSHQPPTPTSVSTPNTPVGDSTKASKARTPGNNIDQSPRPPQSGTPAGDTNVQSVVRISQAGGSQPGTPNSAPNNGSRQSVSTPSSLTPPTAKSNSESSNSKPSDGPNAQIPTTQKPSESVGGGTNTSAPQQRLVNFPPSQLNRDKAPNFPPRGEDLQQYASTFYQKASKESSKSSGRLQHFGPGSPVGPEMMGQTGENMNSQSTMLRSQPDNSQPQIMAPQQRMMTAQNSGISQPESMTTQTGVMPLQPGMMTSQSGMMTSQPGMMTSQPGMMTSQSGMMTSQSGMMTSQPGMMTHPRISTSQEMSSHPCMMSPQSGPSVADKGSSHLGMIPHSGMIRPQHPEMMTPHGIMTSQQEMMTSHSAMTGMMSPQPNIMTPHDAMHHPPGMMQTRMPTSQQMMSQANMGPRQGLMMSQARMGHPHGNPCMPPEEMMLSHGNMTSQPGMMMSHGGMVTSQAGMMSQQRMMSSQQTMMQQQGMTAQTRMASRSPIIESHGMGFDHHHPMDGPMGFHPMHGNMLNNTGMQDMRGMHSMPNRFPGPKQMQRNLGGAPPTMGHSVGPMGRTSGMAPGGSPIMHIDGNPRDSNLMQSESKPISQSQVGRTIHTSSPSPLSLLQSRFSPPLLPDGKGPKQTLQYFPQGNPTPAPQAQSGNPHLNPSNAPGPQGQGPAPKQIQMPFPLEMVTGNPPSMTPSFGPSQRMPGPSARMCGPESMYPQGYPASNRPRQQLPGYVGTPRHSMQYSGPPMGMPMSNTMGQQMPYPPGYGPHGLPGSNMGMGDSIMHGYNNMPK